MNVIKAPSLPVINPTEPMQREYQPVVAELVHTLKGGMGSNLHSVYIFGSVAKKVAVLGRSNLDIVIVSKHSLDDRTNTLINTLKWRFKRAYPFVTHLSFQFAQLKEVLDLSSIFTWGFMLKHCSVCVYGDDLSDRFGKFEPSWEIAKHWNMDIADWLSLYRGKIANAVSAEQQVKAQVVIAKKLLRASYSLIMHKDKYWYDDPIECGKHFLKYHPKKQVEIDRLIILMSGRLVPKRSVIGILDGYGGWLVKAYDRTEFKIG